MKILDSLSRTFNSCVNSTPVRWGACAVAILGAAFALKHIWTRYGYSVGKKESPKENPKIPKPMELPGDLRGLKEIGDYGNGLSSKWATFCDGQLRVYQVDASSNDGIVQKFVFDLGGLTSILTKNLPNCGNRGPVDFASTVGTLHADHKFYLNDDGCWKIPIGEASIVEEPFVSALGEIKEEERSFRQGNREKYRCRITINRKMYMIPWEMRGKPSRSSLGGSWYTYKASHGGAYVNNRWLLRVDSVKEDDLFQCKIRDLKESPFTDEENQIGRVEEYSGSFTCDSYITSYQIIDDRILLLGSQSGTIKAWDIATKELLRTYTLKEPVLDLLYKDRALWIACTDHVFALPIDFPARRVSQKALCFARLIAGHKSAQKA